MATIYNQSLFSEQGRALMTVLGQLAPRVMNEVVIPIAVRVQPRYDSCQLRIYNVPDAKNPQNNELVMLKTFGAEMNRERLHRCTGFNYEKTWRLLLRRQDRLSWQSKEDGEEIAPSERKYGGAVRAQAQSSCVVGGGSGFDGLLDEFAIQALFVEAGLLDASTLRAMIELNQNPHSTEYFTELGIL